LAASIALAAIALSPGASVLAAASLRVVPAHPAPAGGGSLDPTARRALRQGYLVPNQRAYERAKAAAARRLARARALAVPPPLGPAARRLAPQIGRSWTGGATDNFAPLATGPLSTLAGADPGDSLFDVQVIWDPTTRRFYYTMIDMANKSHNNLAFGFSKGSSPNGGSNSDWCKYKIGFGAQFPDFPKLGDSQSFAMIGSNLFNRGGSFLGSDLLAISKPPSGSSCPAPSSFKLDDAGPLMINATTPAFTPVAANEIDTNTTGFAVARPVSLPATQLSLFRVTRNPTTGDPVIQSTGTPVTVPSYGLPANAPQSGSINQIDTADARPTQAVAAVDPAHVGKFAIWTQHTINVGGRAAVRWYEIDPAAHSLLQSGTASSSSLFEFNGAISPDRQVNGTTKAGGDAMLLNFDTSSSTTLPAIRMVSKVGVGAQSGPVQVKSSPGPLSGFDCDSATHVCRWGDYAAATPDPATANQIWQVSQFAIGSGSGTSGPATSRTLNFVATP
jgi:hypothetical protein